LPELISPLVLIQAVNTAVEAIDKIRDTADAHDRLFIIEVMGRDAGYIALHSGIATGAENILIPERKTDIEEIIKQLAEKERRHKLVNLIVVAEGDDFGGGDEVGKNHQRTFADTGSKGLHIGPYSKRWFAQLFRQADRQQDGLLCSRMFNGRKV
jgi:6-phosphofructokinase 1